MKRCFVLGGILLGMIATSAVHAEEDFLDLEEAGVVGGAEYANMRCSHKIVSHQGTPFSAEGTEFPLKRLQFAGLSLGIYGRWYLSRCWFLEADAGFDVPSKHVSGIKDGDLFLVQTQAGVTASRPNKGIKLKARGGEPFLQLTPSYRFNICDTGLVLGLRRSNVSLEGIALHPDEVKTGGMVGEVGVRLTKGLNERLALRADASYLFGLKKFDVWHTFNGTPGTLAGSQKSELKYRKWKVGVALKCKLL